MTEKKGFVAFVEWKANTDILTDEQAGRLFRAVFSYAETGETPAFDDPTVAMAFGFIKKDIDRTNEKYEDIKRKRTEARLGKTQQKGTNENKTQQTTTKGNKPKQKPISSTSTSTSTSKDILSPLPPSRGESVGEEAFGVFANVFLKPVEHRQLIMNFGEDNTAEAIDDLSCKLADGSWVSDYHYATLTQWLSYRKRTGKKPQQPAPAAEMSDEDRKAALVEQWDNAPEEVRQQYLERYGCKPWERSEK